MANTSHCHLRLSLCSPNPSFVDQAALLVDSRDTSPPDTVVITYDHPHTETGDTATPRLPRARRIDVP